VHLTCDVIGALRDIAQPTIHEIDRSVRELPGQLHQV
jgi:hypothetical protein